MIGAVDIGGTKIAVAAVLETGQIAASAEWPTASIPDPAVAVQKIAGFFRDPGVNPGESLRGIGVGCTGPVHPIDGVVGDVELLPGWEGFPLAARISEELAIPTAVENDADAAALAESKWGAGKGASRFLYVTVSTGIGTGFIVDGQLYRGSNGAHPELGHHTIDMNGPPCYCGSTGCWEILASGPAMVRWVYENSADRQDVSDLTACRVCAMARRGDSLAMRAIQREACLLGIGLANLVTGLCPDAIALGGGVMQSADLFLDGAVRVVRSRCRMVPCENISIVPAMLGASAPLLGAARVWQSRFGE